MNTATIAAPGRRSFRDVWLISAGHGLTHWYTATFYLLLPLIGKELGLSYTEIGLIMTVQHLAGAISNLPGGMLVDTVGRKGLLMGVSLFWVGFPYLLIGFSHGYLMLLIASPWSASATAFGIRRPYRRSDSAIPTARDWSFPCTAWAATSATRSRRW